MTLKYRSVSIALVEEISSAKFSSEISHTELITMSHTESYMSDLEVRVSPQGL